MTTSSDLFLAERGAGRPVLYVHGQPGLGADGDAVAEALGAGHRVLLPDRPGYGGSGPEPASMEDNAALLADLLRARAAVPATVVAHSYGGGVALLLAARCPELVAGLVLVGSIGRSDSIGAFDRVLALPGVGEVMTAAGLVALGRLLPRMRRLADRAPGELGTRLTAALPDEGFLEAALSQGHWVWRSVVTEQRFLLREIALVGDAVDRIAVPTIVVTGTRDVVVPPKVAVSLAATIPGAQLVIIGRAGHFVPRDKPRVVAAAVRRIEELADATARDMADATARDMEDDDRSADDGPEEEPAGA
ncbi:MAG TPA: alpha/beta hydrolase [Acidimicrobiales bacterium]|nr:alpha/beta hydrolase [Acidimicrobiales bacterium]